MLGKDIHTTNLRRHLPQNGRELGPHSTRGRCGVCATETQAEAEQVYDIQADNTGMEPLGLHD